MSAQFLANIFCFQMSRSASPPPALHLSMQQLPLAPSQQVSMYNSGLPGKFQKHPRCLTRLSRPSNTTGINRVQSMPAHPAPIIQFVSFFCLTFMKSIVITVLFLESILFRSTCSLVNQNCYL